jgi:hypothetical protein
MTRIRLAPVFALCASVAIGQDAELSGLIQDPSKSSVSGAEVNIRNEQTGGRRSTTSNESGFYSLPALRAAKHLIPVLAADAHTARLPPPIRDAHAMTCTYANVIKLVEEVAPKLGFPIPRTTSCTNHIDAVLKAAKAVDLEHGQPSPGHKATMELLAEARSLKRQLKEIRRRWPDSDVLIAPLDRYSWGAAIGQTQIDADVQEGMRFDDNMTAYASSLDSGFPKQFDLASILQNQQKRKSYNADRVLDLLDDHVDRFQDALIQTRSHRAPRGRNAQCARAGSSAAGIPE